MSVQVSRFRIWRPTRGEGFAFYRWWCGLPADHQGRTDRALLSMWGDVQRQAYFRGIARGKAK